MPVVLPPDDGGDDIKYYTPEQLREFVKTIENVRQDILFNTEDAGADPESEQWFLLALATLDAAHRQMAMAALKQSQGLAALRMR